jgi:hypothetical protein
MITSQTVRKNEWNEALCFKSDIHPKIEIASQRSGSTYHIFYITPYMVLTLKSFGEGGKIASDLVAEKLARKILERSKPTSYVRKHF